jgi:hypothetical protein
MSAGNFTVFNAAKIKFLNGTILLNTHSLKGALLSNAVTLSPIFAGSSTNAQYSDITSELTNGNGYTTGGNSLTSVSLTETSGVVTFTTAAPSWTSSTFTAKYIVLYDASSTNHDLIGYMDLETTVATGLSPSNGTLTVNPNASGWFTLN